MRFFSLTFFSLIYVSCVFCQNNDSSSEETKTTSSFTPTSMEITTTPNSTNCDRFNGNCKDCVKHKECYYCEKNNECHAFELDALLPDDHCPLKERNVGTCNLSLMVIMILAGVAVGIVIIGIICCCCCCCRRNGRIKLSKDDLKWARQREERKARTEEKRQERAARTEEIRRKYGLFKDDTPYQRFDA